MSEERRGWWWAYYISLGVSVALVLRAYKYWGFNCLWVLAALCAPLVIMRRKMRSSHDQSGSG